MPNVTNSPAATFAPSQSQKPDTLLGFLHDSTQYTYASPAGTTNDVDGGFPRFIGNIRLNVTLAAGNATWTGLGEGIDGQHVVLWNTDAANTLVLSIQDAGSLASHQFMGPATTLGPGNACELVYYAGAVNAWVIVLAPSTGGGGGTTQLVSATITAASTNDYNPGGGFPVDIGYLNLNPTVNDVTLTGLAAGSNLQQVVIRNVGSTYNIVLSTGGNGQGDPLSSANNRFVGQGDGGIPPGGQMTAIYYISPSARWSIG